MGKAARDRACAQAHFRQGGVCGVPRCEKRCALRPQGAGIMELMPVHRGVEYTSQRGEMAIAQMQFALGKGRFEPKEPCHGMSRAIGILETLAQHHIAAAFAIDPRSRLGRRAQAVEERCRAGEPTGMQLRIASGQEDGICARRNRIIRKRRDQGASCNGSSCR